MGSTATRTKTILVADDTAFVRDRFRSALEQAGHRVVVAANAAELLGFVTAEQAHIDLVVLDLRLSSVSGVSLVQSIRKSDGGRLTILVFSGTIASADEVRALASLGISGYINEYSAVQHILPSLAPHLHPDRFNRRASPRVVLAIPIQYRYRQTIAAALTLNLSNGGVAIRTTSPLETGTAVRTRFRIPGDRREVDAEARVAWSDNRLGMGLCFEQVESASQMAIDAFVDAHFFSNRKA